MHLWSREWGQAAAWPALFSATPWPARCHTHPVKAHTHTHTHTAAASLWHTGV